MSSLIRQPSNSSVINPDTDEFKFTLLREANAKRYLNEAVILLPLSDGRTIAVFGRDFEFEGFLTDHEFYPELKKLSEDALRRMGQMAKIREANAFYGEPDDRKLARDLKRSRREPTSISAPVIGTVIELDC